MYTDRALRNGVVMMLSMFFLCGVPALAAGQVEPTGDFIEDFDQDGDGMVSADEFPGPQGHFAHLDQDDDGYITEDERPAGPPPPRGGAPTGDGDDEEYAASVSGPGGAFGPPPGDEDADEDEDDAPRGPPGRSRGPGPGPRW